MMDEKMTKFEECMNKLEYEHKFDFMPYFRIIMFNNLCRACGEREAREIMLRDSLERQKIEKRIKNERISP